jgi:hypothetical protein
MYIDAGRIYYSRDGSPMPIITEGYMPNAEACQSFRFRLREAARMALEMGDALLQMSQDAAEPTREQLADLRDLEQSLDINQRVRVPTFTAKP